MQKNGKLGKLRFYEPDHESKMRLLKTHSHNSNRLAMEPETREEKQLKETRTLRQGKRKPIKNLPRAAGVAGGAQNALVPAACRRCGGGGAGKAVRQTNHRKGTMPRRALVDMEGKTGASTREKSCKPPPAGHRQSGGLDEETTNTRNGT